MTSKSTRSPYRHLGTLATLVALALLAVGYLVYARFINLPPAQVYIAQRGTVKAAVYGTVTIQPAVSLPVNAQNSGYIFLDPLMGSITTGNGTHVKKDQLLATITDEATTRLLAQARTDAEAALSRQKLGPASLGSLKSAQDKLAAYQKLPAGPDGVPRGIPRVDFEASKNEVARVEGAVNNEKLELQRQLDTYNAVVKTLETQLKHAEVRSPLDGTITAVLYNNNSYVPATALLFTVADDAKYVSGLVNEEDVGKLRTGMKAELRLYAYGNTSLSATLNAVLPTPDATSSRYAVILFLDNPPDNLLFGLTGEMNIILGRKEGALIIPSRALLIDQVLIVRDGVVEQRTVKTGFKSMENLEVTEGLKEGDEVIVNDQDNFQPGQRVRPVRTNGPGASKKK